MSVEVTATRWHRVRRSTPDPDTRLAGGDVIVLHGTQRALAAADVYLLQG
jgi:uncharacterized protein with PhoU and TrkA domain